MLSVAPYVGQTSGGKTKGGGFISCLELLLSSWGWAYCSQACFFIGCAVGRKIHAACAADVICPAVLALAGTVTQRGPHGAGCVSYGRRTTSQGWNAR